MGSSPFFAMSQQWSKARNCHLYPQMAAHFLLHDTYSCLADPRVVPQIFALYVYSSLHSDVDQKPICILQAKSSVLPFSRLLHYLRVIMNYLRSNAMNFERKRDPDLVQPIETLEVPRIRSQLYFYLCQGAREGNDCTLQRVWWSLVQGMKNVLSAPSSRPWLAQVNWKCYSWRLWTAWHFPSLLHQCI